jgi:hypothetical protein
MNISPQPYIGFFPPQQREQDPVIGQGLTVFCHPDLEDPEVVEVRSRAACLFRPYAACQTCPHQSFTLTFDAERSVKRQELVACPRWANAADRLEGKSPEGYIQTEVATCQAKPFEFCPSCPVREALLGMGLDKSEPGWYGRWHRLNGEQLLEERGRLEDDS